MTREQWKERLTLIQAFVDGKKIELLSERGNWVELAQTNFQYNVSEYRIAPEPKLRPWTANDVPPDCRVRRREWTSRWVACVGANIEWFCFLGYATAVVSISWNELLSDFEHSVDGGKTWQKCGVLEDGNV